MAYTRATLRTHVKEYGFHSIPEADLNRMIGEAGIEFAGESLWPFREMEQSGAMPLTLSHLIQMEQVTRGTTVLKPAQRESLVDRYVNLTTTGSSEYYYSDGQRVVRVFPVDTTSHTVRGYALIAWQATGAGAKKALPSIDSDELLVPEEFEDCVLLLTRVRCLQHRDDEDEAAQVYTRYLTRLEQARDILLRRQVDEKRRVRTSGDWA